jgi:pimeloyl-ACP methyl ester carboxylesterase
LNRVHLVGFSYGADIALRFAVEHPELLNTLVVTEPALFSWLVALPGGSQLFTEFVTPVRNAKSAVQSGELERGVRLFIESILGSGAFEQLSPSLHDRLMTNARLIGFESTEMSESATDITRDEVATIKVPTLILTGDASPKLFLLVSQELARYLPNSEQTQISSASHLLHSMNPQAYNEAVMTFLAKHAD